MLELKEWHHAYVLEGEAEYVRKQLEVFFADAGVRMQGNPDYRCVVSEQFLIDDAHRLVRDAHLRPVGEKKVFVFVFGFITHEAQNALLKLFEEPPAGTHFFLIVPTVSILLPTVRSRMMHVHMRTEENNASKAAETFLQSSRAERLTQMKDLASDRAQAAVFLDELEHYFAKHERTREQLEVLYLTKQYIRDRGASPKLLLEYVALMV